MLRKLAVAVAVIAALGVEAASAATVHHHHPEPPAGLAPIDLPPPATHDGSPSFWLASTAGEVWAFGDAPSLGSSPHLSGTAVAVVPTSDAQGYWLATSDGGVFAFGDAPFHGSAGGLRLKSPIVAMAATQDGGGYWLVAADGGVFAFGDAPFLGSTGAMKLNRPIVGLTPAVHDRGYWLVASDGGVFTFGSASFHGSTGAMRLNQPIVSMAATTDGAGYWMLTADGGVFNFGDAQFAGSNGASPSLDPAEEIVGTGTSAGYWIVDQNGTATGFGDAVGMTAPPTGMVFRSLTAGDKAVLFALSQLGKQYVWGGNGPDGYDCSGLALASWQHGAGIGFARVAADQYHTAGAPVPPEQLAAGDLVFWGSNAADWTTVYHTAVYVGGGQIVEATGDHVQVNALGQWGASDIMPNGRRP